MADIYEITSVREGTARGREITEIRTRRADPSNAPAHCIETTIEQSATEQRASKMLAVYLTPSDARRWAELLAAAAAEAERDTAARDAANWGA